MYALLIAQDLDERAILSLVLQRAGLAVTMSGNLERAMNSWADRPADLIFLAASGDPLAHAHRIRTETEVPLVALTEPLAEDVHCRLLDAGADLVVFRPFSARLLMAQIRALLRRVGNVPLSSLPTLNAADLMLDPTDQTVQISGHPPRRLTHLEFRLLYTLMTHRGQTLSTDVIVERVWGYSDRGDKDLVRGLVSRLRAKVEPEPRTPRYVLTVPGVGYSFNPDEAEIAKMSHPTPL